jgi:hypothetical protein
MVFQAENGISQTAFIMPPDPHISINGMLPALLTKSPLG